MLGRAALHHWEEPCLSGERGSGTVFFAHCNLQCVYCQNAAISRHEAGVAVSIPHLAEIFLSLQDKGAENINLVTPTHYIPQILTALKLAKQQGLTLPIVYNTGGYESTQSIDLLDGAVDVYLPDFKYFSPASATRYSHAPDYPQVVKQALDRMVEQVGEPRFDQDGMIRKGVIVRHLILPGCEQESAQIISYLHRRYGERIYISLMNQYTPCNDLTDYPELARTLPRDRYDALIDYAVAIGVENGFVQEDGTALESFIPAFDGTGCE